MKQAALSLSLLALGASLAGAGCGDDNPPAADGATADAATDAGDTTPDATPTDAPTGPVTVTVIDSVSGLPVSGATVLFHAADGALATTASTDADGTTSAEIPAGGSVTVARRWGKAPDAQLSLRTIFAVAPGDHLTFGYRLGVPQPGTMHIALPPAVTSFGYSVSSACGGGYSPQSATVDLAISGTCDGEGDLVAHVFTAEGELHLAVQDATFTPGATLDLTGRSWELPATRTVELDGVPTGLTGLGATLYQIEQGRVAHGAYGEIVPPSPGSYTIDLADDGVGDSVAVAAMAYRDGADQAVYRVVDQAAELPTVDLGAGLLPWVSVPYVVGRRVSWSRDGSGTPDGGRVELRADTSAGVGWWTLIVPPDATEVELPALPDDLDALFPASSAVSYRIELVEAPAFDAASFRQQALGLPIPADLVAFPDYLGGATGTVRTSGARQVL